MKMDHLAPFGGEEQKGPSIWKSIWTKLASMLSSGTMAQFQSPRFVLEMAQVRILADGRGFCLDLEKVKTHMENR